MSIIDSLRRQPSLEEMSMFIRSWKKEIMTIPNLLSLFRLVLIPLYVVIYLNAQSPKEYFLAGTILAASCLTDMIDGQIARRCNMITNLGKVLDPFADKATQFTLTLCLSLKYPSLRFVLVLFVVKESFQLIAMILNYRKGKVLPGALFAGKVCTTVLFVSLIAMVLFPGMDPKLVDAIAVTDTAFLALSFISYILAYYGKHTKVEDVRDE